MDRIAALRAKAASSTFPAEQAAFTAKADQLEAAMRVATPTAAQLRRAYENAPVLRMINMNTCVVSINDTLWVVRGKRRDATYELIRAA